MQELGLTADERSRLEEQGLLVQDNRLFYMPELIRHGLHFALARRGRARVVSLYKRAALRHKAP